MNPETGRRFGPYEIQGRLGGGGMGQVFRAWDARLHREVAIKLLHNEYAMPGMRERFLREARAASALNHPNICTVFDIGEQDGDPYLVMELLEGETLKDRIARSTIQVEALLSITRDVAEGLAAAHAKGVVHRDIKPANIFLVDKANGKVQAKVLDFGLAKIEGGAAGVAGVRSRRPDITSAGATVGTLAYMSPEQARGEMLDPRSDLFSLGVVMYEMATRRTPFQGATSALVFVQLLNHPPDSVREWNDVVPRELEKIILKLMAKERAARFQSAGELEAAIARLDEKAAGGGWLRRAIATVPLVRAADPVARNHPPRKQAGDGRSDAARDGPEPGRETERSDGIPPAPAQRAEAWSVSEDAKFLRPVARMPRPQGVPGAPGAPAAPATSEGPHTEAGESVVRRTSAESEAVRESAISGLQAGTPPETGGSPAADEAASGQAGRPAPSAARADVRPATAPERSSPDGGRAVREHFHADSNDLFLPVAPWVPERRAVPEEPAGKLDGSFTETGSGAPVDRVFGVERRRTAQGFTAVESASRQVATPAAEAVLPGEFAAQPGHLAPEFAGAAEESLRVRRQRSRRRLQGVGGLLAAASLMATIFVLLRSRSIRPPLVPPGAALVVTGIENRTGNSMLDGTIAEGLLMVLGQSPYLRLADSDSAAAALRFSRGDARLAAQRLGARAYLSGSIGRASGVGAQYLLRVDLVDASSNQSLASAEEQALSLQQIPGAIDRLADDLRAKAGEGSESIAAAHNGLSREGTANLEALHAFAQGESALAAGQAVEGLGFYQQAVALDPRFVRAQLRLGALEGELQAEVEAGEAARLALAGADSTSERTRVLAQYGYEMGASRNYGRATAVIRAYLTGHPLDSEGLTDLARVLRLQGRLSDALQSAQEAYAQDAFNRDAYVQAERSLLGLDRFDAAIELEQQTQRVGLFGFGEGRPGAYLEGRQEALGGALTEAGSAASGPSLPSIGADSGLYLDNSGQMAAGLAFWRRSAEAAGRVKGLGSAQGWFLAKGALDRALVGDCAEALALVREAGGGPQGLSALFDSGMSAALCGDRPAAEHAMDDLQRLYPQSTEVNLYLLADLRAALALQANDPAAALEILRPAREYDLLSLTPYLRGLAHVRVRQVELGIVDFQTVLSHRGLAFVGGTNVYPMAQIQVARAFADSGDAANSAAAYRQFVQLWRRGDPGQPLLGEAQAGAAEGTPLGGSLGTPPPPSFR